MYAIYVIFDIPSGRAVSGVGFERSVAETVGANSI
jgi:hypothetical protein